MRSTITTQKKLDVAPTIARRITSVTGKRETGRNSTVIAWIARCYSCHLSPEFDVNDYDNAIYWVRYHNCKKTTKDTFTSPIKKPRKAVHHSDLRSGITGHSAR